ncbi:MAG: YdcF family protein [Pseudomonadota bacterium]
MSGSGIQRLGRILRAGLVLWLIGLLAIAAVQHFWTPGPALPEPADAIICLSAGMASETSPEAGPSSVRRAETCAALYHAGLAPQVIFTGAGHEFGSAAAGMAVVARGEGVPEAAISVEPRAHSTIQNAAFSLPMIRAEPRHVIVVSDAFHLPRAWIIFRAFGAPDITLYPTPDLPAPKAWRWILRESIALWFNLWRAVLYGAGGIAGIDPALRITWFD